MPHLRRARPCPPMPVEEVMSAPEKWSVLRTLSMVAVHRGEEQIFYLEAGAGGRESAVALAKLLNDRDELLEVLKEHRVAYCRRFCHEDVENPDAHTRRCDKLRAAIAKAEGKS